MREIDQAIAACLTEKYGPPPIRDARPPVEGLRVEMHPTVYRRITQDPDVWQYSEILMDPEKVLAERYTVPVLVRPDMPKDTWRLVIVTEEVLLGGGLPDGVGRN